MGRKSHAERVVAGLGGLALLCGCLAAAAHPVEELRGTGDLGIVVERVSGSVVVIETTNPRALGRIDGLGDLSHASAVYSRDGRYAYGTGD